MRRFTFSRLGRLLATLSVVVAATAGSGLLASPAQAQSGEHCLVVMPDPGFVRCFATFEQARQFAEEAGAIGPPKGESGRAQAGVAPAARASAAASLTLLSVEFNLPLWNPAGGSRWVYGTNGPCTTTVNDVDYQLPDWSAFGFDQTISSFLTYNNCWARHYDLVNYGGLAVGYQGSQAVINAALNDDTTSERWS